MKKFGIVLFIVMMLIMSTAAMAQSSEDEPCTTAACLAQAELDDLIAEWESLGEPEWMEDLISDAIGVLLKAIATQRPMIMPWSAYASDPVYYLRYTVVQQFGEDMSDMITDDTLEDVWDAIADEFETELYAEANGITNTSDMSYYLKDTGYLLETLHPRLLAKSKMNSYDLSITYITPATPVTASMPSNPDFQGDLDNPGAFILGWPDFRTETWRDNVGLVKDFIAAGKMVYILVNNSTWHRAVIYALNNPLLTSIPMSDINSNVRFMYMESEWMEARTSSPFFVKDGTQTIAVCPRAGVPWCPTVDDLNHCEWIADYLGVPLIKMYYQNAANETIPLHLEGGNIIEVNNTAFISDAVFREMFNPGLTQAELEDALYDYLGITDVVLLPLDTSTTAGHVEDWVMAVNANTLMVAEGVTYMTDELDAVADVIEAAGFNVVRIPLPIRTEADLVGTSMRTFTHSVIAGDTVIMPTYGDALHPFSAIQDLVVKGDFEDIFPTYTVETVSWPTGQAQGPHYCTSGVW